MDDVPFIGKKPSSSFKQHQNFSFCLKMTVVAEEGYGLYPLCSPKGSWKVIRSVILFLSIFVDRVLICLHNILISANLEGLLRLNPLARVQLSTVILSPSLDFLGFSTINAAALTELAPQKNPQDRFFKITTLLLFSLYVGHATLPWLLDFLRDYHPIL